MLWSMISYTVLEQLSTLCLLYAGSSFHIKITLNCSSDTWILEWTCFEKFTDIPTNISRVSDQNGVSLQWYIVEIHHSGRKSSIHSVVFSTICASSHPSLSLCLSTSVCLSLYVSPLLSIFRNAHHVWNRIPVSDLSLSLPTFLEKKYPSRPMNFKSSASMSTGN